MLLTQKPQPINFSRHHRRHPASLSNIAVVPHPTSTPGLLSLSKPVRPPPRNLQRPQSPRFPPRSRLQHRQAPSVSLADLPSSIVPNLNPARGRSEQLSKVQTEHSGLASPVHMPNTPAPSAPVPTVPLPFPPPHQAAASPEPPTLAAQPSGRLARSRRTRHKSTSAVAVPKPSSSPERSKVACAPSPAKQPQPTAPIAVPERRRAPSPSHKILSRSDPLSKLTIHTNLASPLKPARKDKRRRNRAKRITDDGVLPLAEWDFPAPGSSEDEGDDDEPVTPLRQTGTNDKAWLTTLHDGPKTAPIQPSATSGQFPFFTFPSRATPPRAKTPASMAAHPPTTPPRRPEHRRAPSQPASLNRTAAVEGMFNLSEDESESLATGTDVREKMALLFGTGNSNGSGSPLFPSTGTPSPSRKPKVPRERESVDGVARQLFASSSFQIAPEPVELPKPSFLFGARS
ncbi:hypothetical protein K439DRAFT_997071 [Ramaria rubella]|nr:hypothetical protein K439DRAFT_997071 [Ramaria rubella]